MGDATDEIFERSIALGETTIAKRAAVNGQCREVADLLYVAALCVDAAASLKLLDLSAQLSQLS